MSNAKQADNTSLVERSVDIDLGERSYTINIGRNLLSRAHEFVPWDLKGRSVFILTDENVSNPHAGQVYECIKSCQPQSVQLLALPSGEKTKAFSELERVVSWIIDHGVERGSVIFAVGGGVIGDLTGFAASIVMRGIGFVQVPTTLLAQVDSSVGGKTAVNVPQGKNLVGSFYQPISVICDIDTLKTLPRREILAGYAEIVKYGLINDPEFFIWLEKEGEAVCNIEPEAVAKAIEVSCKKKSEIVSADEFEKGSRALLNLGHTFGHALEAAAGYDGRLLHGEAVAIGMVMAFHLSCRMGICDQSEVERVEAHLASIGLPTKANMIFPPLDCDAKELFSYMKRDKKVSMGEITFIITEAIGKARISKEVDHKDVMAVLENSLQGK